MKLLNKTVGSSSCSKAELIAGLSDYAKREKTWFQKLEKFTRAHLVNLATEAGIISELEERSDIMRILRGAGISFSVNEDTSALVRRAVDAAIERYGVADIESLGKNLKRSRYSGYAE